MITPMDIHNKEFNKGIRGYKTEEVDEFLKSIVDEYETFYRENRELKEKIEHLQSRITQYEQMEGTMNNTLVLAQETAENVKTSARKEADLIIQDAEQKRDKLLEDAVASLKEAKERYEGIRGDINVFKAKVESILSSQLRLLDDIALAPLADSTTEDVVVENVEETTVAEETVK